MIRQSGGVVAAILRTVRWETSILWCGQRIHSRTQFVWNRPRGRPRTDCAGWQTGADQTGAAAVRTLHFYRVAMANQRDPNALPDPTVHAPASRSWRALPGGLGMALVVAVAGSCGGPRPATIDPRPQSANAHYASAEAHDRAAAQEAEQAKRPIESRQAPFGAECFDNPVDDISTSGTERLRPLRPCWTDLTRPAGAHQREAERQRQLAAKHRATAKGLLAVERESCAGLGSEEISLSPFHHVEDIVSVNEYREKGVLRGARIVFRKIEGLTEEWFLRSATCHQARSAVLGYPPTHMPYCPMSIQGVQVSVVETAAGLEVTVRGSTDVAAHAAYGRVKDLLDPNHPFRQQHE